jgi:WD40 repeat protein
MTVDTGGSVLATAVFASDPRLVAYGSGSTVAVADRLTGEVLLELEGHTHWVTAMAVAADGTWIASGSSDKTVRVWNVASGQCTAVLDGHTDDVNAVAVAADGTWIASGSEDKTVRVWNVASGQCTAVVPGMFCCAFPRLPAPPTCAALAAAPTAAAPVRRTHGPLLALGSQSGGVFWGVLCAAPRR